MSEADVLARLQWLQKLASDHPGESVINMSLIWENEHTSAGVTSTPTECIVFLSDAEQNVESLAEATHVLRAIFADEIIAVRAYAKEQMVYWGLAPATDLSAGFNGLAVAGSRGKNMPDIDHITVETWSRGLLPEEETPAGSHEK